MERSTSLAAASRPRGVAVACWFGAFVLCASAKAQDATAEAGTAGDNRLWLQFGVGRLRHGTNGNAGADDDADATWFRLAYEYARDDGFGGGARLDVAASDDDLFDDQGTPSEAGIADLFVHATWTQVTEDWRVPLRFGLSLHDYTIEDDTSGDTVDWFTFGVRLEVEPEWRIATAEEVRFSLAAPLDVLVGPTWVETDPDTEDWSTSVLGADVGLSLRIGTDTARFEIGYRRTWLSYDETDAQAGLRVRGIDVDADFLALGFLLRF